MFKTLFLAVALLFFSQGNAEAVKWVQVTATEDLKTNIYVDEDTITYPAPGVVQYWNMIEYPPEGFYNPKIKMVEKQRKHLYRVTQDRMSCSIQAFVVFMDGSYLDTGALECKYSNIPPDSIIEEFWKYFFKNKI